MKDALLITWYNSHNYGSVLQAYATKEILKNRYGINVRFLNTNSYRTRSLLRTMQKLLNANTYQNYVYRKLNERAFKKKGLYSYLKERDEAIKSITKEYNYVHDNRLINKEIDFSSVGEKFDLYIVGSDQLWNPNFICPHLLLDFVKNGKVKISLSTSLSCNCIPNEKIGIYKKYLKDFRAITIREPDCVEQLKGINSNVYCTLDPTIIYGRNNWDKKIVHKKGIDGYILCYILGKNAMVRKQINILQSILHRELYHYPHMSDVYVEADNSLGDRSLWKVTPFEWIEFIENAHVIITDSYHMTLFSIMFHKDFWVITKDESKPAQSNRIFHILRTLGIENRFIDVGQISSIDAIEDQICWETIDIKLSALVEKSINIWDDILLAINE